MNSWEIPSNSIAIIGISCQVPGAPDLETFWNMIKQGNSGITYFTNNELLSLGVEISKVSSPNYVKASSYLEDVDLFDADFFEVTPTDAELMDPQHRLFLHHAWSALENANLTPIQDHNRIGIFAGCNLNTYLLHYWSILQERMKTLSEWAHLLHLSTTEHLVTKVAYKLNLQGPCLNVQSACSTSLSAVHIAIQSLLMQECDAALTGGVSVTVPQSLGHLYETSSILTKDGFCRPFSKEASGTLFGSGVGVIVLKRLEDALKERDHIYAVIKGSAMNNDGKGKMHFTSPSVVGQRRVISDALALSETDPKTISYLEAHGTGTHLGDPIEMQSASEAYGCTKETEESCIVGSTKANIGHLNSAAGVVSLIKAALQLKHKIITPLINFKDLNEEIKLTKSLFKINSETSHHWEAPKDHPRRSAVSSFGIGGTNVHMILEEAPKQIDNLSEVDLHLLIWSARTQHQLEALTSSLLKYLEKTKENIADIAYTLQNYRQGFSERRYIICNSIENAIEKIHERIFNEFNRSSIAQEATQWLNCQNVVWSNYANEVRKKVSVPGMVFNAKKFWLSSNVFVGKPADENKSRDFTGSEVEKQVADVWIRVLRFDSVPLDTHFYEIGGDSLAATHVLTELEAIFPLQLSMEIFDRYPTIQAMASHIEQELEKEVSKLSESETEDLLEIED